MKRMYKSGVEHKTVTASLYSFTSYDSLAFNTLNKKPSIISTFKGHNVHILMIVLKNVFSFFKMKEF